MLANLVFSCPNLSWNEPTDHVELFAGVCSITKGEWEEECGDVVPISMGKLFLSKSTGVFDLLHALCQTKCLG